MCEVFIRRSWSSPARQPALLEVTLVFLQDFGSAMSHSSSLFVVPIWRLSRNAFLGSLRGHVRKNLCSTFDHLNTVRMWNTTVGLTQVAPISTRFTSAPAYQRTSAPAYQRTSETAYQGISVVTCLWHPAFGILWLSLLCSTRLKKSGELLRGRSCTMYFLPLTSCPHAFMLSCLQACLCILRLLSIYPYMYILYIIYYIFYVIYYMLFIYYIICL